MPLVCALVLACANARADTPPPAASAASAFSSASAASAFSSASAAPASASASYARLPLRREGGPEESTRGGLTWLLLFALPLAIGVPWWMAKRGRWPAPLRSAGQAATTAARRTSGTALTGQASVHVVRWAEHDYLLGCTPHAVSLLDKRPAAQAQGAGAADGVRRVDGGAE